MGLFKKREVESQKVIDSRELEFLELRKKENSNELMTAKEMQKLNAYKTREVVNQILRIAGLCALVFFFVLTFDIFGEGAVWGLFNGKCSSFWETLYSGGYLEILKSIFRSEQAAAVFGCLVMSIIHITLIILMVYMFAFEVRDIIGFFRRIFISPVKLMQDISATTVESVEMERNSALASKSLFDDETRELINTKKEELGELEEKKKKRKAPKVKKVEPVVEETQEIKYTSEELDMLVNGATLDDIKKNREITAQTVENPVTEFQSEEIKPRVEEQEDADFMANLQRRSGE